MQFFVPSFSIQFQLLYILCVCSEHKQTNHILAGPSIVSARSCSNYTKMLLAPRQNTRNALLRRIAEKKVLVSGRNFYCRVFGMRTQKKTYEHRIATAER